MYILDLERDASSRIPITARLARLGVSSPEAHYSGRADICAAFSFSDLSSDVRPQHPSVLFTNRHALGHQISSCIITLVRSQL